MGVVCTSDSDQVVSFGSRKGGEAQRWQRWVLPDEEGPPAVPPFESADGEIFEDQYIVGLALDVTNTERIALIAGEEKFPPSPVVWALTSHGSLLAWTALHKKAPPGQNGSYPFMKTAKPLPGGAPPAAAPPAAGGGPSAPAPAASALPAPAILRRMCLPHFFGSLSERDLSERDGKELPGATQRGS